MGGEPGLRARRAGYPPRGRVAENLAKGLFTPDEVLGRWMNSPGHRRNLLLPEADDVGFGIAVGRREDGVDVLWVQLLAIPGAR